jgi:deazaflavin-dependent oxidoreductase (nitroreductase family)
MAGRRSAIVAGAFAGRAVTARRGPLRAVRRGWLWLVKNTLNRVTTPMARAGVGPLALVRHVGRKTGRRYETPLLLARLGDDFVAELTYGPSVSWYRNVAAAGRCEVVVGGRAYPIDGIEILPTEDGLRAFGHPAALGLKLLRRRDFRLLRRAG